MELRNRISMTIRVEVVLVKVEEACRILATVVVKVKWEKVLHMDKNNFQFH